MERKLTLAAICLLAGCVGTTEIVPVGKDSYLVAGHNGSLSPGEGMIEATKKANAYCASLSKVMLMRRTDTSGLAGFTPITTQLIFSCVSPDDPEYRRPDLHRDATTVIEDARH